MTDQGNRKKWCRYCNWLTVKRGICICTRRGMIIPIERAKKTNKCPEFEMNPIDALGINPYGYRPRKKKRIFKKKNA